MDWGLIWERISDPPPEFFDALWATIYVSVIAQAIGVGLGLVATLMRNSGLRVLRILSGTYVLIFRGTPVLVQLFFFYAIINFNYVIDLGKWSLNAEGAAAILALGINEGAYMREVFRAGIDSVDQGQTEAAKSLGMGRGATMRRIILPQALRVIVPPLGNEFNNMMKTSSLAYTIGVYELFADAQGKYSKSLDPEFYVAVAFWYLMLTTVWSVIQALIERKLGVSDRDESLTFPERLAQMWSPARLWRVGDAR